MQGVGFRPYIQNTAKRLGLVGFVQNTGYGILIAVNKKNVFKKALQHLPPTAEIQAISVTKKFVRFLPKDFTTRKSTGKGFSEIPPDFFTCDACIRELNDPKNRRFGYFFTTCTNCGPRFTITKRSPYDRDTTSMSEFPLCKACRKEYTDPSDRRFHAQTIACHDCGPELFFLKKGHPRSQVRGSNAIRIATERIKNGEVVAVKGVGGFHLICLTPPNIVRKLKALTGRTDKPFAVLCKDIPMARTIAVIPKTKRRLLLSKERPIVLCQKKIPLKEVTELDTVGILLPYTALHHLLFTLIDVPLVCTSANLAGEPITTKTDEQFSPYILTHTREILRPTDDSLIKVIKKNPIFIRRSRGYVPRSLAVPNAPNKTILALGAEMNATFCLLKNGRATLSQYLGNVSHPRAFKNYQRSLDYFLTLTRAKPQHLLCDLHPQYETTKLAKELSQKWNIPLTLIQHHNAHSYGVARENNLREFTAIVCDGLGYGTDGTLWGGEVFLNDVRVGHLEPQWQLGGDSATQYPDKMLFSILKNFLSQEEIRKVLGARHTKQELLIWDKQLTARFNTPKTTSCGRILDAACALLEFPAKRSYDGRGAMILEANSTTPYSLKPQIQNNILLTTPIFQFLVRNLHKNPHRLAATVQNYLAEGLYEIARQYKRPITFSGGCAYNRIMTEYLLNKGILINKLIPPGDSGISFGQVAYFISKK